VRKREGGEREEQELKTTYIINRCDSCESIKKNFDSTLNCTLNRGQQKRLNFTPRQRLLMDYM
jgi:hypothetical protein